ncbi:MAG: hypothetical protein JNL64_01925 [Blastocatellia bacterium]|jgi:hypothetical protein|nr:hypothetical protein [Blastocatellia bacterium]
MIKDLGTRVATIWEGLRPVTKNLIEGTLTTGAVTPLAKNQQFYYDAKADWEVTDLLNAVDEVSTTPTIAAEKKLELEQLADTCVRVLLDRSASAEVFILLASRSIRANDFVGLDKLTDVLAERFSPSEIAEIIRQTEVPQIRALAFETLAMLSVQLIAPLLDDPLYTNIAVIALEQKAWEFESEEARDVLDAYDAGNFPE